MQLIDNARRPIAFFSPAQCKYSTFSRELLGLYLAVKHFPHYFEGNPDIIMYCDHEPLVKAFYPSNQIDNARQCRHLSEIPSLYTNLRFIEGCDNVVADVLSRIEINSIFQHAAKIDWHTFAKTQRNDYELKRYLDGTNFANVIEEEWNGATLLCDVSSDGTRARLNERDAQGKFVTARPPKRLAKPSSVSHALVSTLQKHRSKTSKLIQFGSLHFGDSCGWPIMWGGSCVVKFVQTESCITKKTIALLPWHLTTIVFVIDSLSLWLSSLHKWSIHICIEERYVYTLS